MSNAGGLPVPRTVTALFELDPLVVYRRARGLVIPRSDRPPTATGLATSYQPLASTTRGKKSLEVVQ